MSSSVAELADRLAIQDVLVQYATSCDARDMDAYGDCFLTDALVTGFGAGNFEGRQAWVDYVTGALKRFAGTQHFIGNQVVKLNGDTATMRTYVQATHVPIDKPKTTMTLFATYYDELVRDTDGKWRIKLHRLEPTTTQLLTGE